MSIANIPKAQSVEFLANTKETNLCQKIYYIIKNITVEPVVFLYMLPAVLNHLTVQNLNLEKACRVNLAFNVSICDALSRRDKNGYDSFHEEEVQKLVSTMMAVRALFVGSFPAVLMLFFGSWSDRHSRRKPVMIIPLLGDLVTCVGLFLCAYFFMQLPMEMNVLSESGPFCLSGGWFTFILGSYTYISEISADEERTVRIGAVSMCQNIAITVGIFLSGFLLKPLGFQGVFLFSMVLYLFGITYIIVMIKDTKKMKENTKECFLKDFFNIEHIKKTFLVCFKEGENNRKKKVIVIMFCGMMIMGPFYGEMTVLYLYTRLKFSWNEVDYSVFNSIHFFIQLFGSAFALTVLSKYLKLNDATLGIVAMLSKIGSCLIYPFAPTWIVFYAGALVEVFHGTSHIAMRSLMGKIVPPEELGQANSIFGMCEAITPLVFGPIYTSLYNSTINFLPGAFYLASAGFYMFTLAAFTWLYIQNTKDPKRENAASSKEQEEKLLKAKIGLS